MTCWECIDGLVRTVEIPHMLYRNYDKPELVAHYLRLLRSRINTLKEKRCITKATWSKLFKGLPPIEKALSEKKAPYEETEAILSVLKSECVIDVADYCSKLLRREGPLRRALRKTSR